MSRLEVFALFVMPGLTLAMAAAGYLIVRLTRPVAPCFAMSLIDARESPASEDAPPPDASLEDISRLIRKIYPADMAADLEADLRHYLHGKAPQDRTLILARFRQELRVGRIVSIRDRLMHGAVFSALAGIVGVR